MNAPGETKTCPMCAETIKAAARLCPHCRSRQSRWVLWWQELTGVGLAVIFMVVVALVIEGFFPEDALTKGRNFSPHRADLAVVRTTLATDQRRPEFSLSGFVTNQGPYAWRVREIEVRFLNPDGSLLDVQHPPLDHPFVVQPAAETAFRVTLGRLPPVVASTHFQTRVHTATDGNLARDPD